MGFFGFSTKKEVEEKERQARAQGRSAGFAAGEESVINRQQSSLGNLGKGSQVRFSVPWFDVFDPRFMDFGVPVSVHGSAVYAIEDRAKFNAINKAEAYSDAVFEQKLKGQLVKYIKSVVTNAPAEHQIQVLQIERKIIEISDLIQSLVTPKIEQLFGVTIRSIDVTEIMVDHDSRGYKELKSVTSDLEGDRIRRMQEMSLSGQEEMQRMQLENQMETMRIQREEMQRAARLQTETNFLSAHQANLNAGNFAQNAGMPQMPSMAGMPQMPGMQPAMPQVQYMVGINGQPQGPFNWQQLQMMVQNGQLTHTSQVWKQGMAAWAQAGEVQELTPLFSTADNAKVADMPPMM